MKKSTLIPVLSLAGVLAAAGAGVSYAATTQTTSEGPMNQLVSAISTKFNLNKVDVQAVFDEQHSIMEAERAQAYIDRLNEAVTAGDLTQAQADLLVAKRDELAAAKPDKATIEQTDPAERHAEMKKTADELKAWAIENSISEKYLPLGPGGMHRRNGMNRPDDKDRTNAADFDLNSIQ